MANKLRKSPPVCFFISLFRLLIRTLKFSSEFKNTSVSMGDGAIFKIFRYVYRRNRSIVRNETVFIVNFKFKKLSHRGNKLASVLPMLLITGFPGFVAKMYAVNQKNGYWQGMYQWQSEQHLEEYKKSFVFKTMKKRAEKYSVKENVYTQTSLKEFIKSKKM